MSERWRQTPTVIAVEEDLNSAVHIGGRWHRDVEWVLPPETVERIRLGYVCLDCLEPHEEAFPENCTLCTFPMRSMQIHEFARRYQGEERLKGAGVDEELARMSDESARRKFEREQSQGGIVVPRGFNGNGRTP